MKRWTTSFVALFMSLAFVLSISGSAAAQQAEPIKIGGLFELTGFLAPIGKEAQQGAVIFVLSYFVSLFTPERWPLILGACFVTAVMFARGGLFPQFCKLWNKVVAHRSGSLSPGGALVNDGSHEG